MSSTTKACSFLLLVVAASLPAVVAFAPFPTPASRRAVLPFSSPSSHANRCRQCRRASSERSRRTESSLWSSASDDGSDAQDEARVLAEKAEQLREQIRQMEANIGEERRTRYLQDNDDDGGGAEDDAEPDVGKSLANKRVLVLGANGRLGSMVTRHLLRTHGKEVKEVVAAVHFVGQATTRGYGRLSYEVGAEDGRGTIGAAWSGDDAQASFEYDPEVMGGYHLDKLRVVEVELLDPVQVRTITEGVDAVIYCATDFEGNRPRAVASLNAAFLFRAVANPTKGRVEVEGLRNCLEGLVGSLGDRRRIDRLAPAKEGPSEAGAGPTQFVLASATPDAFGAFETPFGEFNAIKRQGERMVLEEFPSVSGSVLQLGKFDDNFVKEGQEVQYAAAEEDTVVADGVVGTAPRENDGKQKRINRRDAARAAVEALLDADLERKKVQVYTSVRQSDIW